MYVCLFVCLFVCSFVRSIVRPSIRLVGCLFVRSFIRLFDNLLFVHTHHSKEIQFCHFPTSTLLSMLNPSCDPQWCSGSILHPSPGRS